jgi:hypothetical protein
MTQGNSRANSAPNRADTAVEWLAKLGFQPDKNIEGNYTYYQKLPSHEWLSNETVEQIEALLTSEANEAREEGHTQGMIDGLDMSVKVLKERMGAYESDK